MAIGPNTVVAGQATAIGDDVYALGYGSIAIGSDDNPAYYTDNDLVTSYDYDHFLSHAYADLNAGRPDNNWKYGIKGNGSQNSFERTPGNAKYSPTIARGMGAIAIGTRSVALTKGSTAVGALAFAFGEDSTAVGAKSRAEGKGSIALGNKAISLANNAIATGNEVQVLKDGGSGYGFRAYATGLNSLAIGTDVFANSSMEFSTAKINQGGTNVDYYLTRTDTYGATATDASLNNTIFGNNIEAISRGIVAGNNTTEIKDSFAGNDAATTYLKNKIGSTTLNGDILSVYDEISKESTYLKPTIDGRGSKRSHGIEGVVQNQSDTKNAIVIGSKSMALETNAIALGHLTASRNNNAVAIGSYSTSSGVNSVALGTFAKAYGKNSMGLGTGAIITPGADNAMAIGASAIAKGLKSMALGTNATVEKRTDTFEMGNQSMAIGNGAKAWLNNSLALGVDSETDYTKADLDLAPWVAKGAIATATSGKTGIISVGKKNAERRIVNVASGAKDTDAVNVAQLRSAVERLDINIDELRNGGGAHYTSINSMAGSQAAELAAKIGIQANYDAYVTLKSKYLAYKAREKYNGEKLNASALSGLEARIAELKAAGLAARVQGGPSNGFDYETKAAELKKLENQINAANATDNPTLYNEMIANIESAEKTDATANLGNPYTEEQILRDKENANYNNDGAKGKDSIAYGYAAKVDGASDEGIALGVSAELKNNSDQGIAIGKSAVVDNSGETVAIGKGATANTSGSSLVMGTGSTLTNSGSSVALGKTVTATGSTNVVAIGSDLAISGSAKSVAIGYDADLTNAQNSVNIGNAAKISEAENSVNLGLNAEVKKSSYSVAIGDNAKVINNSSQAHNAVMQNIAIGNLAKVDRGLASIALGKGARITAKSGNGANESSADKLENAVAIGTDAIIENGSNNAIAIGKSAYAGASAESIAIGKDTKGQNGSSLILLGTGLQAKQSGSYRTQNSNLTGGDASAADNNDRSIMIGHDLFVRDNSKQVIFIGNNEGNAQSRIVDHSDNAIAIGTANVMQGWDEAVDDPRATPSNPPKQIYASSRNSAIIGSGNTLTSAMYSTVLGNFNTVGDHGNKRVLSNIVIGNDNNIKGSNNSIYIGDKIREDGQFPTYSYYNIAMGYMASPGGVESIVIGKSANVTTNYAVAIGSNAVVSNGQKNVAIGYGSVDRSGEDGRFGAHFGGNKAFSYNNITHSYNDAGNNVINVVSVGSGANGTDKPSTRRIINVTAGQGDTDAVNMAQLRSLAKNEISLAGDTGQTNRIELGNETSGATVAAGNRDRIKFGIKGAGGITTSASGSDVTVTAGTHKYRSNAETTGFEASITDAIDIRGGASNKNDVTTDNTYTYFDGSSAADRILKIAFKKTPTFEGLNLGSGSTKVTFAAANDGSTLTLAKSSGGDVVLKGIATPTAGTDAANKAYVDGKVPTKATLSGGGGITVTGGGQVFDSATTITIQDGALSGAKLTDGTVTKAKLDSTVQGTLDSVKNKADASVLNNYATTQALTDGLAAKADKTALNSLATKQELTSGLAAKIDKTEIGNGLTNDSKLVTGSTLTTELGKKANASDLTSKANTDATNIDVTKYAEKLGTGTISKTDSNLVKGSTVATALESYAKTDASNVTDAGAWAGKLGTGTIGGTADNNLVTGTTVKAKLDLKVDTSKIATVFANDDKLVTGAQVTGELAKKIDKTQIGSGTLASSADKLVTGSMVTTALADKVDTTAKQSLSGNGGITVTGEGKVLDVATTISITDGGVTAAKLATDAVTSDKIQAGAVTDGKIANDAINSDNIKANAITEGKIKDGAVTAGKIGTGAVTGDKLGAKAVTAEKIADGTITTTQLNKDINDKLTKAGQIDSLLANKADKNLGNIDNDGKKAITDLITASNPTIADDTNLATVDVTGGANGAANGAAKNIGVKVSEKAVKEVAKKAAVESVTVSTDANSGITLTGTPVSGASSAAYKISIDKATAIDNVNNANKIATAGQISQALDLKLNTSDKATALDKNGNANKLVTTNQVLDKLAEYATTEALNNGLAGKLGTDQKATALDEANKDKLATVGQVLGKLGDYATTSAMNSALANKLDTANAKFKIEGDSPTGGTASQGEIVLGTTEPTLKVVSKDTKVLTTSATGDTITITPNVARSDSAANFKADGDKLATSTGVQTLVNDALGSYAKIDGSNFANAGLDNTKKKAWASALGTGTLDNNTETGPQLVTGNVVKTYVDSEITKLNIGNKANISLDNINDAGKDVIAGLVKAEAPTLTGGDENLAQVSAAQDTDKAKKISVTVSKNAITNVAKEAAKEAVVVTAGTNVSVDDTESTTDVKKYKVSVSGDLKGITSITNDTTGNTGTKLTISNTGVDLGSKKLTGVAAGSDDNDVVNVKQLKDLGIDPTATADNKKPIVVYDKKDKTQITVGNGNTTAKITNLTNGSVASGSKDAVTGGQLYNAANSIATALGKTLGTDGAITAPTFSLKTKSDGTIGTTAGDTTATGTGDITNKFNTVSGALGALDAGVAKLNETVTGLKTDGLKFFDGTTEKTAQLGKKVTIVGKTQTVGTDSNAKLISTTVTEDTAKSGNVKVELDINKDKLAEAITADTTATTKLQEGLKLTYKSSTDTGNANQTALSTGLVFTPGSATDATAPNAGVEIKTEANGVVKIGLSNAIKSKLDNLADNANTTYVKLDGSNFKDAGLDNTKKNNWASALGTGTLDGNQDTGTQLVTGNTVKDELAKYTKLDGTNLKDIDAGKWATALGKGTIGDGKGATAATDKQLVTGTVVNKAIEDAKTALTDSGFKVAGNTGGDQTVKLGTKLTVEGDNTLVKVESSTDQTKGTKLAISIDADELAKKAKAANKDAFAKLGGGAGISDEGVITGPTYSLTTDTNGNVADKDGNINTNKTNYDNVGAALTALDKGLVTANEGIVKVTTEVGKNKDAIKEIKETLGLDGANGAAGTTGTTGPAGSDGLDGQSIPAKVEAGRNGLTGTMVYTTKDGDRLTVVDGKYYKASDVKGKVLASDGKFYDKADLVDGTNNPRPEAADRGTTPTVYDGSTGKEVFVSAVNVKGETTTPVAIGNVASGLGLENVKGAASTAIAPDKAKEAVKSNAGKTGLLDLTGNKLNNVATIGDLQAVAQAGLDFEDGQQTAGKYHAPLGSTVKIQGATNVTPNTTNYSSENLATKIENSTLTISFKKAPQFDSVALGTVKLTPTASSTTGGATTPAKLTLSDTTSPAPAGGDKVVLDGLKSSVADDAAATTKQVKDVLSALGGTGGTIANDGSVNAPSYALKTKDDGTIGATAGDATGGAANAGKTYTNVGDALKGLDAGVATLDKAIKDLGTNGLQFSDSTNTKTAQLGKKVTIDGKAQNIAKANTAVQNEKLINVTVSQANPTDGNVKVELELNNDKVAEAMANSNTATTKLQDGLSLSYKVKDGNAQTTPLSTGLVFTKGTGTNGGTNAGTDAETTKAGVEITTAANGVVTIGLSADVKTKLDNLDTNAGTTYAKLDGSNVVKDNDDKSAKISALDDTAKKNWATALGGTVGSGDPQKDKGNADTDNMLVTGKTVYEAIKELSGTTTTGLDAKADKTGANLVQAKAGAQNGEKESALSADDRTNWATALGTGTLDGNATTGKQLVTGDTVKAGLDTKANADASNVTDAAKWAEKLGTGTIGSGDTNNGGKATDNQLVTGKTVKAELDKKVNVDDIATGIDKNGNNDKIAKAGQVAQAIADATTSLTNSGFKVAGNTGGEQTVKLNETLKVVGDGTLVKVASSNDTTDGTKLSISIDSSELTKKAKEAAQVAVVVASGKNTTAVNDTTTTTGVNTYKVNINETLTDINSITSKSGNDLVLKRDNGASITVGTDAITVNNKITGLGNGTVGENSTDAVTGSQLNKSTTGLLNALGGTDGAVGTDGTITAPKFTLTTDTNGNVADKDGNILTTTTDYNTVGGALSALDKGLVTANEGIIEVAKVVGSNKDRIITIENQLSPKDGIDGANGAGGADGLNGKTTAQKVQALRDGLAGATVFTDNAGARLEKVGEDYFKADDIDKAGLKQANDGKYYEKAQVDKDGNVIVPENGLAPTAVDVKTRLGNDKVITADKIQISAVSPDGSVTKPVGMGNVASGLGSITVKDLVDGNSKGATDSEKAVALTNTDLNKVATVKDLQTIAKAGINFTDGEADTVTDRTINAPLASTVKIQGNAGVTPADTDYSSDNLATKADAANKTITISMLKTPTFDAVNLGTVKLTPTASSTTGGTTTPAKLTLSDTTSPAPIGGDKVVLSGLKDGELNTNSSDAVTGKQLFDKAKQLTEALGGTISDTDGTITAPTYDLKTKSDGTVGTTAGDTASTGANTVTNKFNNVKDAISAVDSGVAANKGDIDAIKDTLGLNGANGNAGATGQTGPAGADGLNGQSIPAKVEAGRNGLTGTMVYTNEAGDRLTVIDGKYYKADEVKDKVLVDGKFYDKTDLKPGTNELTDDAKQDPNRGKTISDLAGDKVFVSAVKVDGSTTEPVALRNVSSLSGNDAKVELLKDGTGNSSLKVTTVTKATAGGTDTTHEIEIGKDGKITGVVGGNVAANSKEVVTGGNLYNSANGLLTALGGEGGSVGADGTITAPTFKLTADTNGNVVNDQGVVNTATTDYNTVGGALSALDKGLVTANEGIVMVATEVGKGLNFTDGQAATVKDNVINTTLGSTLKIQGKADVTAVTAGDTATYSADNLATMVDVANKTITISMLKTPTFDAVNLGKVKLTPSINGDKLTLSNTTDPAPADGNKVVLDGLKSSGADDAAATTKQVKDIVEALGGSVDNTTGAVTKPTINLQTKSDGTVGTTAGDTASTGTNTPTNQFTNVKDAITAVDKGVVTNKGDIDDIKKTLGLDGTNGAAGTAGATGPAGADGQDGKSIPAKVEAGRNGLTGTMVYTDKDGNRLTVVNGKYYKADDIKGKVLASDGKFYAPSDIEENTNNPKAEATQANRGTEPTVYDGTKGKEVFVSAVKVNGSTTESVALRNIDSISGNGSKVEFITDTDGNNTSLKVTTKYQTTGENGAKNDKTSVIEIGKDGKITGLANATISATSTDAVTGAQLHETRESMAKALGGIGKTVDKINEDIANIGESASKLDNLNDDGKAVITGLVKGAAATLTDDENLATVTEDIDNTSKAKTIKVGVSKKAVIKTAQDAVTVIDGKNTKVETDTQTDGVKKYKVNVAGDLKGITSITNGDGTSTDATKITINNDGVSLGNKKLSGVADGSGDNDVVNIKQLKDLGLDPTAAVDKKKPVVTFDGPSKETITLGNGTAGTTTKITNLTDGAISESSTDAITGKQLFAKAKEITEAMGGTIGDDGTITKPTFELTTDKDGNVVDNNGEVLKNTTTHTSVSAAISALDKGLVTTTEGLVEVAKVVGSNKDRIVTIENQLKPKNGIDGTNGAGGADGLNGKTTAQKVQAGRDGLTGATVFTDDAGNRLKKVGDDYFKADDIKAAGLKQSNDGNYYNANDVDKNGNVIVPENGPAPTPVNVKDELAKSQKTPVDKTKLQISAVNPDGSATKPVGMGNVASGLGLENVNKDSANDRTAIEADAAQKAIAGDAKDGKGGLLVAKGADLNKVATIGDLQAVAQAGLDFTDGQASTVTNNVAHAALGTKIKIQGATDVTPDTNNYSSENIATMVDADKKTITISMKKTPKFDAVELGKVKLTPDANGEGLTLSNTTENAPNEGKVALKGVKEGDTADSVATKGSVDEVKKILGGTENQDGTITKPTYSLTTTKEGNTHDGDGNKLTTKTEYTSVGDALTAIDKGLVNNAEAIKTTAKKLADTIDSGMSYSDGTQGATDVTAKLGKKVTITADANNLITTKVSSDNADGVKVELGINKDNLTTNLGTGTVGSGDPNVDKGNATTDNQLVTGKTVYEVLKATKGEFNNSIDDIKAQLGITKGDKGDEGVPGIDGTTGPGGKDGQNGKSLAQKVQAGRDGLSGATVYTNKQGERLDKIGTAFFKASDVAATNYTLANDGKYYNTADVDKSGNVVEHPQHGPGITADQLKAELEKRKVEFVKSDDLIISAVNPDGTAMNPTVMGNVASGLGLANVNKKDPTTITDDEVKTVLNGNGLDGDKKTVGLLNVTGNTLNNVATIGDLQATAKALNANAKFKLAGDKADTTLDVSLNGDAPTINIKGDNKAIKVDVTDDKKALQITALTADPGNLTDEADKNKLVTAGGVNNYVTNTLESYNKNVNQVFNTMSQTIKDVDNQASAGIAAAMASAQIPQVQNTAKNNIAGIGFGSYRGQKAVAVGLGGMNNNRDFIYKASLSYDSQNAVGFSVGLGFSFGSGVTKLDDPSFANEYNTKINIQQEEIHKLQLDKEAQGQMISELKDQNSELQKRNDELEKRLDALAELVKSKLGE